MAFKTDSSFLDKISMGAVGTKAVINHLVDMGHQIIELERYCTSNKIWSTKIKRLRIPDLLCLHCGRRIESRAKSKLGIIMSDSEHNEDRRWFSGLRDTDWVAFIQCFRDTQNSWAAGNKIYYFSIGDMKNVEKEPFSKLGAPKSPQEGAECDRTWKTYIPKFDGRVVSINHETSGKIAIRTQKSNGSMHTHRVDKHYFTYVDIGEEFDDGTKILAGVVPLVCDCGCTQEQYDFLADLVSNDDKTVYTAVKALGYLPASDQARIELQKVVKDTTDDRIRLEAYASLIRLNCNVWEEMYQYVFSLDNVAYQTEYVLILGEIESYQSAEYLFRILHDATQSEELRAAAAWSLRNSPDILNRAFEYCFAEEDTIANHIIAKIKRHFCSELTATVLDSFCEDDRKNAICSYLLSTSNNVDYNMVFRRYLEAEGVVKDWILYTIGISKKSHYWELVQMMDSNSDETKTKLMLLWNCQPYYLTNAQMDNIAFIEQQK